MTELGERLRKARLMLQLSEGYVARELNVDEDVISQMELGEHKISDEELSIFSDIYCIPTAELLCGTQAIAPSYVFSRASDRLESADQEDILNLMEFKRIMKAQKVK